jgi:crotonobetainyl-CoA:carnitine CoA-transferase CaiB-like acyl-CoA transferase
MNNKPLDGITVLDFSIIMSGPLCTRMLADAGATVIKIEPLSGDTLRNAPPFIDNVSAYYGSLNCGKKSIVLDLKNPKEVEIVRNLAASADIIVENFKPGVMKRLGLDYESLQENNKRLIYTSISGYGQTGPLSSLAATAPAIQAASGYELSQLGYQPNTDKPATCGIFIADVLGGSNAFAAIQLALYEREKSGMGQYIDVSLMDCMLSVLISEVQTAQNPAEKKRLVYEPIKTKDGWFMVTPVTLKTVHSIFDAIGYPEGKTDSRFLTVKDKEEHKEIITNLINEWAIDKTSHECEEVFNNYGIPCAAYKTVKEVVDGSHLTERGSLSTIDIGSTAFKVVNSPFKLSRTPVQACNSIAQLGEHNEEILGRKVENKDE